MTKYIHIPLILTYHVPTPGGKCPVVGLHKRGRPWLLINRWPQTTILATPAVRNSVYGTFSHTKYSHW